MADSLRCYITTSRMYSSLLSRAFQLTNEIRATLQSPRRVPSCPYQTLPHWRSLGLGTHWSCWHRDHLCQNIADVLTKALLLAQFKFLVLTLGMFWFYPSCTSHFSLDLFRSGVCYYHRSTPLVILWSPVVPVFLKLLLNPLVTVASLCVLFWDLASWGYTSYS